jgi:hypothetical protein
MWWGHGAPTYRRLDLPSSAATFTLAHAAATSGHELKQSRVGDAGRWFVGPLLLCTTDNRELFLKSTTGSALPLLCMVIGKLWVHSQSWHSYHLPDMLWSSTWLTIRGYEIMYSAWFFPRWYSSWLFWVHIQLSTRGLACEWWPGSVLEFSTFRDHRICGGSEKSSIVHFTDWALMRRRRRDRDR